MAKNITEYDIIRVIALIQERYPKAEIGEYEWYETDENFNFHVRLTNGTITVTRLAVEDIEYADKIPSYYDNMISSFKKDSAPVQPIKTTFWRRFLNFLGF